MRVVLNSWKVFNLPTPPPSHISCTVLKYNFLTGRYVSCDIVSVSFFFFYSNYRLTQLKWLNQLVCIVVTPLICYRKILNLNYGFQDLSQETKLMGIDLLYQRVCQPLCNTQQR